MNLSFAASANEIGVTNGVGKIVTFEKPAISILPTEESARRRLPICISWVVKLCLSPVTLFLSTSYSKVWAPETVVSCHGWVLSEYALILTIFVVVDKSLSKIKTPGLELFKRLDWVILKASGSDVNKLPSNDSSVSEKILF